MWRFHSFLDPKVLVQPAKEKAQGKGRVCAAAMCLRSDDESLKGAWLQWSHRVSCLGVVCLGRLLRGLILDDDVGVVKSSPWYWISSCAESLAPCDEAASSSFPLGGVQSAGRCGVRWFRLDGEPSLACRMWLSALSCSAASFTSAESSPSSLPPPPAADRGGCGGGAPPTGGGMPGGKACRARPGSGAARELASCLACRAAGIGGPPLAASRASSRIRPSSTSLAVAAAAQAAPTTGEPMSRLYRCVMLCVEM